MVAAVIDFVGGAFPDHPAVVVVAVVTDSVGDVWDRHFHNYVSIDVHNGPGCGSLGGMGHRSFLDAQILLCLGQHLLPVFSVC